MQNCNHTECQKPPVWSEEPVNAWRCTAATDNVAVNLLNFGKKHTKILDKVKVKLAQLRQRVNDLACDDMAAPLVAWQLHNLL